MLDMIKYASLKLRKQQGRCIPQGPAFTRAKTAQVLLPRCKVEFCAPRHAPLRRHGIEEYMLVQGEVYGPKYTYTHLYGPKVPSESWKRTRICSRSWAFYGPWFTGYKGDVGFSMNAAGLAAPNPHINFLHPAALEMAAQAYATAHWGHELYHEDKPSAYYRAPVNWKPLSDLPVPALQFDIEELQSYGSHRRYVLFPVSRDRLLSMYFRYSQSASGNWQAQDAKVSPEPMLDLIENITASIRMIPSPELQAEIDAARAECDGDYAVSPVCPPFQWPADVDRDGLTLLDYRKNRYPRR